ncbi:carboxypeptidase-like regulatory domain-containing protein [Achromobacter aloeverae]
MKQEPTRYLTRSQAHPYRPLMLAALAGALVWAAGMASAHAALPATQTQGSVEYVTGGIGLDESQSLKAAEKSYPLSLLFARKLDGKNDYTADVKVVITDAKGGTVLDATSGGPYMLVKLPPGEYKVSATLDGTEQTRKVSVKGNGSAHAGFEWNSKSTK